MADTFSIRGVSADARTREAAVAILKAKAKAMFKLEAAAGSGKDVEALHDMRVASRRLREALRIFRPLCRRNALKRHLGLVRSVTRTLGAARSFDVSVGLLEAYAAKGTDPQAAEAAAFMLARGRAGRQRARKRMVRRLNALKLGAARRGMVAFFEDQKGRVQARRGGIDPDRRLAENARPLIAKRLEAVFEHREGIRDEARTDLLHRMRIAAKKLRYAMETLRVAFGEGFDAAYGLVEQAQEMLGRIHDLDVIIATVEDTRIELEAKRSTRALSPGMAKLAADLRLERGGLYGQFMVFIQQHDRQSLTDQILGALAADRGTGHPPCQ